MKNPSCFKAGNRLLMIRCCLPLHKSQLSTLHSFTESGSFLNKPSPLQGASTKTKSNKPVSRLNEEVSLFVTTVFPRPHLITFSFSTETREAIVSLETIRLSSFNKEDR